MNDVVWGMDNGRFACLEYPHRTWHPERWDRDAFLDLLAAKRHLTGCRFVVAPDVLFNFEATVREFWQWREVIAAQGYPVALALQDGSRAAMIPWGAFDALFIGGTNAMKFSDETRRIVRQAKRAGLWVHWGRASTPNVLHYCRVIGCDSVDGSALARFQRHRLPEALAALQVEQLPLFEDWRHDRSA